MKYLTSALASLPAFQQLLSALDQNKTPVACSGLATVHRAALAAALHAACHRPILLLCADEGESQRMAQDLTALTGIPVPILFPRPFTLHSATTVSHQWEHQRLQQMDGLGQGQHPLLVATVEGVMQRTLSPAALQQACLTLSTGQSISLSHLTQQLVASGYVRCDQVEGPGQFALRGGILDLYSPAISSPVRMELLGDEIDSMGLFDPSSQRRQEMIQQVRVLPAAEVLPHHSPGGLTGLLTQLESLISSAEHRGKTGLSQRLQQDYEALSQGQHLSVLDRYLPLIQPQLTTVLDHLPPNTFILLSENSRIVQRARSYQWQLEEEITSLLEQEVLDGSCHQLALPFASLMHTLSGRPLAFLDSFPLSSYPLPPCQLLSVEAKQLPSFGSNLESNIQDLGHYQEQGYRILVLVSSEGHALKLQTLLQQHKIPCGIHFSLETLPNPGELMITLGNLSAGMDYPRLKLALFTQGVTPPRPPLRTTPKSARSQRERLHSYADLSPGDLVVHEHHGVGRYEELVKLTNDGVEKDYLKIAYDGSDVLYLPATQMDLISKYIGGGEDAQRSRRLARLGGGDWQRAKSRAKKAVQDLAKGLIQLYAQRQKEPGHAFAPDLPWQREFEEQFEYSETEDQLRCIEEIKRDMERPIPMDRLLCGDVGYGKTEVAFRAIMKCVLDGRQAAILVPTTVLARQHYLTALRRFASYPIQIEVLSRFRTPAQIKETLRRVQEGTVDLLIGTHQLFHKNVRFKALGLLVVDEEQRFGVQHKERLKENFRQVDVLTLSATPIPRTLHMAMSGIRDMSTLEEPPANRQPVQTYVLEHDWAILGDAIRRELARGGQVYYLHNRVETIHSVVAQLQQLLSPDPVSIGIAHGHMNQEEMDQVMSRMTDGDLDILVCTTIIETGIDLPNVNTLIIEQADHMGLAQLHQLRGRVGRSSRRAFAYLTYRPGRVLSEVATRRLSTIREFAEFGSGFKIAMRDLEIRGAGNLLGPEQSGFLLSVGYDMYLRLLEEAVLLEQGKTPVKQVRCSADLTISASVPTDYVASPAQRMDLYRRIAAIRCEEDGADLLDEMIDRYGDPPQAVHHLISVALLRQRAAQVHITDLTQRGQKLTVTLEEFDLDQYSLLAQKPPYQGRLTLIPGQLPRFALRLREGESPLTAASALVSDFTKALSEKEY